VQASDRPAGRTKVEILGCASVLTPESRLSGRRELREHDRVHDEREHHHACRDVLEQQPQLVVVAPERLRSVEE
jgi:hypothetical protein